MMMMLMSSSFPLSHQHLKQNRPNPPLLPAFPPTAAAGIGSSSNPTPTSPTHTSTREYFNKVKIIPTTTTRRRGRRWTTVSSSENQTVVTAPTTTSSSPSVVNTTAAEVVRSFYGGINSHDLASVEDLIADNCVYEDLIFTRPFVGRKAILEFFQKFIDSISTDLQFVIDDISDEDTSAVGVMWHLEWKRKPFPFSKGCSFYRLDVVNGKRQITYGRDCVEPATKPGEMALVAIRGVTWLLQQFPQLADQL